MTRLDTNSVAVFLPIETLAPGSSTNRTERDAEPFGAVLQRAGRSADTGADDAPKANQSGPPPSEDRDPTESQSNSTEQDYSKRADTQSGFEESPDKQDPPDTPESPANTGDETPKPADPETAESRSDEKADPRLEIAGNERLAENAHGRKEADLPVEVTAIGAVDGGQEPSDDAETPPENAEPSRDADPRTQNAEVPIEDPAETPRDANARTKPVDETPRDANARTEPARVTPKDAKVPIEDADETPNETPKDAKVRIEPAGVAPEDAEVWTEDVDPTASDVAARTEDADPPSADPDLTAKQAAVRTENAEARIEVVDSRNRRADRRTKNTEAAPEDLDSPPKETPSRQGPAEIMKRHQGRETEPAADQVAEQPVGPGRSEPTSQAAADPLMSMEQQPAVDPREPQAEKPAAPTEDTPQPTAVDDEGVTESEARPEEDASHESRLKNSPDVTVLSRGEGASSREPGRQARRQGSVRAAVANKETPAADRSSGTVAQTLVEQNAVPGQERVAPDEIGTQAEEPQTETTQRTAKAASTADVKTTSENPSKGWVPDGLRSTTALSPAAGSPTDQVDRVRFVQRVARAFEALGDGNGSVRLRLKPPELGGLRLEVSVRNGMMTAQIETETATARTLLLDNLPALRERLAQQDIKVDSFNVDLADRSPDDSPQRPTDDRRPRHRGDEEEARAGENQGADQPEGGSVGAVGGKGEGARLDVVI